MATIELLLRQQATCYDKPMVDMIFVVTDSYKFHKENIKINADHYSSLIHFGPSAISYIQKSFGSNVYFNTLVSVENLKFKYGVIDYEDFRRDLLFWESLYIAGRLHKPVLILHDEGLSKLVVHNLESAMHAALLQLPEKFEEIDLWLTIAGLSYKGDFRMIIGEDKNKIQNIVKPQMDNFRLLYSPIIKSMSHVVTLNTIGHQDKSVESKIFHLNKLPINLKNKLIKNLEKIEKKNQILHEIAMRNDTNILVSNSINQIVFYTSLTQSLKGILTAGLLKSIIYSLSKLKKMFKSMVI
ncbi:phosphatidate cytidylyltransferase, mitochondrial [Daktulosphaira vitifoliae]|uniref:phosphatidate cytidylyltransferase, mitochondrial n=1 Tax=Daktulosphaira vitifoliae TaxID=58002 RepID=UPI0021AA1923|nr:phosphatidate cytidylyltransferase, mitochondrial [Daktulosphaira vitifoliae]